MNYKLITRNSILIKIGKLTLSIICILQFDSCSKSEGSKVTATGTDFCCDPYGTYMGVEVSSYTSADPFSGYQSASNSSDYEYTISPKGTDSISVLTYDISTQVSSSYDLSLISASPERITFGWDRSFAPNYIDKHTVFFENRNDSLILTRIRERGQSSSQGSGFSNSSTVFQAIKQ